MKQKYLLLLAFVLGSVVAWAYDFEVDGLYYDITSDNTVALTEKPSYYNGDVPIPSSVEYGNRCYSVTAIGERAFEACPDLTSVVIPNTVIAIGYGAFWHCYNLASVVIPGSVTEIGEYAFYECTGLTEIISLCTVPPTIQSRTFGHRNYQETALCVPKEAVEAYKTAECWKDFQNTVGMMETSIVPAREERHAGAACLLNGIRMTDGRNVWSGSTRRWSIVVRDGKKFIMPSSM